MSTAALNSLRDYLYGTLSPENMRWLSQQLAERAEQQESLKPYTKKELLDRVEKSHQQLSDGKYYTTEEVIAYCSSCAAAYRL